MKKHLVLFLALAGFLFLFSSAMDTHAQCTPTTTVSEGDLFPGGLGSFGVTSGPGTVTVDHVNAGTGLQSLTVVGTPVNAVVTIPAFTPGTYSPVIVTYTVVNPSLPVDFTLRAASTFHAVFIRVRCAVATTVSDAEPGTLITTAAGVEISGRVLTPDGRGLRNAQVWITDSEGITGTAITTSFGYYIFPDIEAGGFYIIGVGSKRYRFQPRAVSVADNISNLDFLAEE